MIRAGRRLKILQVAAHARSVRQLVVVIYVALAALHRGMETGKRPARARVIELGSQPRRSAVTHRAIGREPGRGVRRIGGGVEILHMA